MNKLTVSICSALLLGVSLPALADDAMKGMDMKGMDMKGMDMKGMSMAMKPADSKVAHGVGIITAIDPVAQKVTLDHQAIKELNWPAMKMGFKVATPKLLDGLKVGSKVAFELKADGANQVVTAIKPTN